MRDTAILYDSCYPGSIQPQKEGGYVKTSDELSLALALVARIHKAERDVEDWQAGAIEWERVARERERALTQLCFMVRAQDPAMLTPELLAACEGAEKQIDKAMGEA